MAKEDETRTAMGLRWPAVQKILVIIMILGFGLAIFGIIGGYLGWFSPIRDLFVGLGTGIGTLAAVTSLIGQATREDINEVSQQIHGVGTNVEDVGTKVEDVGTKVEDLGSKVENVGSKLDGQTVILQEIRDRL